MQQSAVAAYLKMHPCESFFRVFLAKNYSLLTVKFIDGSFKRSESGSQSRST